MSTPTPDPARLGWPITEPMVRSWQTSRTLGDLPAGLVDDVIASVVPFVADCRPEFWTAPAGSTGETPREYVPDAEVQQAARMLVARVLRRRMSPGGIEPFAGDAIAVSYVARFDPEIERALRLGDYARPAVG